jgi:hypothetical protein
MGKSAVLAEGQIASSVLYIPWLNEAAGRSGRDPAEAAVRGARTQGSGVAVAISEGLDSVPSESVLPL